MIDRLRLLEPLAMPVAAPHPDSPAASEPVVANPHDELRAVAESAHPGRLNSRLKVCRLSTTSSL